MAELTPVQRADVLVKRGKTEVEQRRIRNVIDEYAKRDGKPELSDIEIKVIEDIIPRADDDDGIYSEAEVLVAEGLFAVNEAAEAIYAGKGTDKDKDLLMKVRRPEEIELLIDKATTRYISGDKQLTDLMVEIGSPIVEPLLALLTRLGSRECAKIIEILAKINDERARSPIRKYIDGLKQEKFYKDYPEVFWIKVADTEELYGLTPENRKDRIKLYDDVDKAILFSRSSYTATSKNGNRMLGKLDNVYAVDALIKNLKNSVWCAPGDAAEALATKKDPRVFEELIKATEYFSNDYEWCQSLHSGVAKAFAVIGDKRAVEPLKKCLKNTKAEFRTIVDVAEALDKLGGRDSIPVLIETMNRVKDFSVRKAIAKLLEKYDDPAAKEAVMKVRLLEKGQTDEYLKLRPENAVEDMVVAMGSWEVSDAARLKIQNAIVEIGEPAFNYCLEMSKGREEESMPAVISSIRALGAFKDKRAAEQLMKIVSTDDTHAFLFNEAAIVLWKSGDKRVIQTLINRLGERDVSLHVMDVLVGFGPEAKEALPKLRELLEKRDSEYDKRRIREVIITIEKMAQ